MPSLFVVRLATAAVLTGSTITHDGYTLQNTTVSEGLVIDGVPAVVGDWVLVKDQADATQNGLYQVMQLATASLGWIMQRKSPGGDLVHNMDFHVVEGTAGAGEVWRLTTADPITAGATSLTFSEGPLSATEVEGDLTGNVLADDGTIILENGTDGTDAWLQGDVKAEDGNNILTSGTATTTSSLQVSAGTFATVAGTQTNVIIDSGDNSAARVLSFRANNTDGWDIFQPSAGNDLQIDNGIGASSGTNLTVDLNGGSVDIINGGLSVFGDLVLTPITVSAAGAIPLTRNLVLIDTSGGAMVITLADGVAGQVMRMVMTVDGGDATVTPATFFNGTTITFNDAGDVIELVFDTTNGWIVIQNNGTTVA